MSDTFDPYHKWLGIPLREQPPHHYRLLVIELFETNREVIEAAANRQMSYLQELSSGAEHIDEAQKLLGEVSRARICLLDAEKKNEYDAQLREELRAANEEFVAEEFSAETTTFADGDGPTAEPPAVAEGIPSLLGGGPDAEAGGRPPIPLPDGMEAIPHTTAHPRGKKQNPKPLIVLAVVALVLVGGGIYFFMQRSLEQDERNQQMIARQNEEARTVREAKEEAQRQSKASQEQTAEAKREKQKFERDAAAARKREADRKATEEAGRKAQEEAELKKKQEAERKVKEKESQEKAKREAETALAALKLKRQKGEKGEPIWYLQNDKADQYKKLQDDHTAEQIEPLEASRKALLQEYAKLDENREVKKHLQRVGGKLATENDLPFWPEEVRDALKEEELEERDTDEGNFWILADEATFLDRLGELDSQRDEFFELRTKGTKGKEEAEEKIESFSKDFSSAKEQYEALSQKYKELDGKDELIAKIESLGNRLGPSLTAVEWQKKQKYFAKVVKTPSRSKSGGRLPKPIFESIAILTLDGTDETQDAKTGQIFQPQTITAEAVVRVKQGRRYGAIVGQALDDGGTEQGWQIGYSDNNFQFRIGPVGDRFEDHQATSKTTLQEKKVHHVVGTYDGRIVRLYVDGKPESEGRPFGRRAPINYPPQASSPFTIGAHKDSDEYFELEGTIYQVQVYAGPLNAKQVAALYNEVKERIDELNNAP